MKTCAQMSDSWNEIVSPGDSAKRASLDIERVSASHVTPTKKKTGLPSHKHPQSLQNRAFTFFIIAFVKIKPLII